MSEETKQDATTTNPVAHVLAMKGGAEFVWLMATGMITPCLDPACDRPGSGPAGLAEQVEIGTRSMVGYECRTCKATWRERRNSWQVRRMLQVRTEAAQ